LNPKKLQKVSLYALVIKYQSVYQANSRQWDNIVDQNIVHSKRQICGKQFVYKGEEADPTSGGVGTSQAQWANTLHLYVLPEFMYTAHEARTISHLVARSSIGKSMTRWTISCRSCGMVDRLEVGEGEMQVKKGCQSSKD
jgi:hypothetical protein